jgi:hypothetical protein
MRSRRASHGSARPLNCGVRRPGHVTVKTLALAVLAIFAAIGVLAVGVFALAFLDRSAQSFDTYAELEASGLIERGWVSPYLPRSARDIDESHDIDTNVAWVSFEYSPGDTSLARQHCQLLAESTEGEKYVCPPFDGETSILLLRADGTGRLNADLDD